MNKLILTIFITSCFSCISCNSQKNISQDKINTQEGVLIYYMHEPYFFPTKQTSVYKISKRNIMGLKLGKIDFNDIYDSLSYKSDIIIYMMDDKGAIDTINSKVGILPVRMGFKFTKTMLSVDSAAFNFEYAPNKWRFFNYEIRSDKEIVSIKPRLKKDIDAFNRWKKRIASMH